MQGKERCFQSQGPAPPGLQTHVHTVQAHEIAFGLQDAALVEDLHERGLDKDVTVLVWGEFGRTPKINERAGRDHWPRVHAALMAGGGMPTGQVIGSTNGLAEEASDRPVHMQEVFATVYRNLGINVADTTITDNNGRPQYLVDRHNAMAELT